MAGTDHRTVMVQGNFVKSEHTSAVTITMGMICTLNSSGQLALSAVATTIFEGGIQLVAEAPERGKGIFSSGTTLNTYAATEQIPVVTPKRGDRVLAILTDGQVVAQGGLMEVAATGKLIAHAGTNLPWARALEAVSPSGADGLILCEKV